MLLKSALQYFVSVIWEAHIKRTVFVRKKNTKLGIKIMECVIYFYWQKSRHKDDDVQFSRIIIIN